MRHSTPDGDDTDQLHPVATDQPGLILHRPLRKLRQVAIVYALLPLVCAAVGAWIATELAYARAEAHTDRRIAALEDDLAQRRQARAQQDAARDAQTRELLKLVCDLLDHATPRDDTIAADRVKYGCTGSPYPVPQPSAGPGSSSPPAGSRTPGVAPPRPRTSSAIGVPSPTAGPPQPSPTGGGDPLVCVKLPLLPRVCL